MKSKKVLIIVVVLLVFVVASLLLMTSKKQNEEDYAAVVNGEEISSGMLSYYISSALTSLETKFGGQEGGFSNRDEFLNLKVDGMTVRYKVLQDGLKNAEEFALQVAVARKNGISLTKEEIEQIDKRLDDSYKSNPKGAQEFLDGKHMMMEDLKYKNYGDDIIVRLKDSLTKAVYGHIPLLDCQTEV